MKSRWNTYENILKFLPLLLLYIVLVCIFSSETLFGDEGGYIKIANHLLGHSPPFENITLWWGPGYPIILTLFIFLKISFIWAKFLNAFLLFGAVIYFNKTLNLWANKRHSIIIAYLLGLYPPFYREIHILYTESLVFLLVCGFIYHFCLVIRKSKSYRLHLFASSIFLGYLALTKVFFGYVIVIGILLFSAMYLWKRRQEFKRTVLIYLLAFCICLPYLFYTYSVTGKIFYWGTSGGMSLYWMSTPYENEWGDWFSLRDVFENPQLSNHREFFKNIYDLSEVEKDLEFKKKAIYNITHHPSKYFINWTANIGRLLFSYPFSYTPQKLSTYFYIIPNMFIVVLFIMGIYPAVLRWKSVPYELWVLLFFNFVAFAGTSLLSAYDRQFRPLVPFLLLWLVFIYLRVIKIEICSVPEIATVKKHGE